MTGSSLWDGPCKEKVKGAGQEGGFPLFTVSLLCVNGTFFYGSLLGRPPKHTAQSQGKGCFRGCLPS